RGRLERRPLPARNASIASHRARRSAAGSSAIGTETTSRRESRPARSSPCRYGPGSGIHSNPSGLSVVVMAGECRPASTPRASDAGCRPHHAPVSSCGHGDRDVRALVIGASGQVGAALLHALRARDHHAVGTWARPERPGLVPLDFPDPDAVERMIGETRPDWVICPAALSHVDYCEEHPDEAFAVNLRAPVSAARAAARVGAGFVYYSSDYVFGG